MYRWLLLVTSCFLGLRSVRAQVYQDGRFAAAATEQSGTVHCDFSAYAPADGWAGAGPWTADGGTRRLTAALPAGAPGRSPSGTNVLICSGTQLRLDTRLDKQRNTARYVFLLRNRDFSGNALQVYPGGRGAYLHVLTANGTPMLALHGTEPNSLAVLDAPPRPDTWYEVWQQWDFESGASRARLGADGSWTDWVGQPNEQAFDVVNFAVGTGIELVLDSVSFLALPIPENERTGLAAHGLPIPAPLLRYRMDVKTFGNMPDAAGVHADGQIWGAKWVPFAPTGKAWALDFAPDYLMNHPWWGAVSPHVSAGNPRTLQLTGALTVSLWVQSFGSERPQYLANAGNWALFLDAAQHIVFRVRQEGSPDWTEVRSRVATSSSKPVLVTAVHDPDSRTLRLYLDGKPDSSVPSAAGTIGGAHAAPLVIGNQARHSASGLNGFLGDFRIFDVSLAPEQVLALYAETREDHEVAGTAGVWLTLRLRQYHLQQQAIGVQLDLTPRPHIPVKAPVTAVVRLCRAGHAEAVAEKTVSGIPSPRLETFAGQERFAVLDNEMLFPAAQLAPGWYAVRAVASDADGRQIAVASAAIHYSLPPEVRRWTDTTAGVTDQVLPPFEPLRTAAADAGLEISMWGRTYAFAESPFPVSISSQGRELLAAPIRLDCRTAAGPVRWQARKRLVTETGPARVRFAREYAGGSLQLQVSTLIEYDGFIRLDWALTAAEAADIRQLVVELPLKPEHARLFFGQRLPSDSRKMVGTLPEPGIDSAFRPAFWLGDDARGLQWCAETDQYWTARDPDRAIQVRRESEQVVLRLNIIDSAVHLAAGQSLPYAFVIQATPVKPMVKSVWDRRVGGAPSNWMRDACEPYLAELQNKGVRSLHLHQHWAQIPHYPMTLNPTAMKRFLDRVKSHDMQLMLYYGFLFSTGAPEYESLADEFLNRPDVGWTPDMVKAQFGPVAVQGSYRVCNRSKAKEFFLQGMDAMITGVGLNSIYLDGTAEVGGGCRNRQHGCGYVRADGTVAPTYAIFPTRDLMRRVYALVKNSYPDGQVVFHQSGEIIASNLAWCTSYWDGEQWGAPAGLGYLPDVLPLDVFRTEFTGLQWGPAPEMIHYRLPATQEQIVGYGLLHNVPARVKLTILSPIWKARDRFGTAAAKWVPYWETAGLVTASPDKCYTSLFLHPANGVLAIISNLERQQAALKVRFDLAALGLPAAVGAEDMLSGDTVPLDRGTVSMTLPSMGWRLVWLH